MKITELLNITSKAYPELSMYYSEKGEMECEGTGDGLAEFIVRELLDNIGHDDCDHDQLGVALALMEAATAQLLSVVDALQESRRKI